MTPRFTAIIPSCFYPCTDAHLLLDILGKNPQTTVVVIDGVDTANWGIAGESVTQRCKLGK